jgi:hypothetical protein
MAQRFRTRWFETARRATAHDRGSEFMVTTRTLYNRDGTRRRKGN